VSEQEKRPFTNDDHSRVEIDRKCYDEICSSQTKLLDKSIITISGASFTIAMGFIDKTVPLSDAIYVWLLWSALLVLALTIIFTVLSFEYGAKSAREWRTICDKAEEEDDTNLLKGKNKYLWFVNILNVCRLQSFLLGICLLASFMFINGIFNPQQKRGEGIVLIDKTDNQSKPPIQPIPALGQEGFNPPTPRPCPAPPSDKSAQ